MRLDTKLMVLLVCSIILIIAPFTQVIIPSEFALEVYHLIYISDFETPYLYFIHHALVFIPVFLVTLVYTRFYQADFQFRKVWLLPTFLVAALYIFWDLLFSHLRIWGFNEKYTSDLRIGFFPMEEILWFLVIPFACLFIYTLIAKKEIKKPINAGWIYMVIASVAGLFYIWQFDRLYSATAAGSVILVLLYSYVYFNDGIYNYFKTFIVMCIPLFLFDGLLTGMFTQEPVVVYNPLEFSNIRIVSIPIEDFMFGFSYIYAIILCKDFLISRRSTL